MDQQLIRSGLDGFRLLERVTFIDAQRITALRDCRQDPAFVLVEAAAQAAALHVRQECRFARHAFLLKNRTCRWPRHPFWTGRLWIDARRTAASQDAYAYAVTGQVDDDVVLTADLLIGCVPYDARFDAQALRTHYQQVFRCLTNGSTPD